MLASGVDLDDIKKEFHELTSYVTILKQRYKTIYEGSPALLRTINTEGIILDCNELYANALGYTKRELVGASIFDTVAAESLDLMKESFESWKKFGYVRNREVLFKRKDGSVFPALVNANNIYDENGQLVGSNTVIHDLSDIYSDKKRHEEFEKVLQKNLENLQRQKFEKEEFVNMLTNELRSAAIRIRNDVKDLLLEQTDVTEQTKQRLKEVEFKSKSIAKMLSDISDFQKIQHGNMNYIKNTYNLSKIIQSTISNLQYDAISHGSEITKDIQENVFCLCDKNRIEQVLVQIISNAIDFSPKEEGKIQVKLRNVVGKYAKIIVRDNGIGIKRANLDKIFQKFYQLDTSLIREHGGAGLGLSICKGIIEGHEGKIWASSRGLGAGTEIHILIPLVDIDYTKIKKVK